MPILQWRLMGAHRVSAAFIVDAGYEAFSVSAFMLLEAQRRRVRPMALFASRLEPVLGVSRNYAK
jgi:hypothetical protein